MNCRKMPEPGRLGHAITAPEMKVLIVEDERKVGQFIERALTEQSHTARLVGSCAAARDALAESPYEAVILTSACPMAMASICCASGATRDSTNRC